MSRAIKSNTFYSLNGVQGLIANTQSKQMYHGIIKLDVQMGICNVAHAHKSFTIQSGLKY
jgi:hypothetical protein